LVTLLVVAGKPVASDAEVRHFGEATRLVFVLDLSPSMHLPDAGPEGKQSRKERMRDVVDAILSRVSGNLKFGAIGFYTESLPVVMEARDPELVRNVTNGLPLTYAMPLGQTDLGKAVNASVKLVADFPQGSTRLVIVTDGDTVHLGSIEPRPRSVGDVLVLGVGNPHKGTYIDGHQSRQEGDTLRGVASALGGSYVDVNEKHVPTASLGDLVVRKPLSGRGLSVSALAVLSVVAGATVYALIPVLLAWRGTDWVVIAAARKGPIGRNGGARE
jgi:Ca-activated chloride channel family protein